MASVYRMDPVSKGPIGIVLDTELKPRANAVPRLCV
eukprot:CAMPEP_0194433568 /NCGR_PEP_ID=MMETSP0176-20130528/77505_1 /TAXON_ID=216777 /ORGANISM="Proboscia alata, Strain PI-D3" /LENGTH=35 /DNA_ID= /DNA_START= /DNA_END= /DNA_ORIENTATION=